ncbi:helix-turn-helix domain-containing protein [Leptospira kirschneri]|uniref:DNA-binding helix-turn-helix protein n=1 Tax=Leptospira kirschneri serovar Bulgarica str. Nikolaevo TaxID=1240687 RepID=M6FCS2_9LEPT|nr:helix-turn-helix transcriptional regulator [Leptospira kirschneri]EMK22420.1 DNA-binding helix-turn-helix protein [Leptospira kirschneri serovar Bulgarica str. Nikolaevo]EMK24529.1 DNA-binding helix-turn-helix protein [Leptospira kirschneri serovar Bulgarica str. Nikolaevo]EMK24852.1 DNA-binding helix-turn-helix protein [Leptospira kirschneri serovar Bulgarica str. Nikolaevo]
MKNSQPEYVKNNEQQDRLRLILSETGLRQNQLAKAGDVEASTLSGYLNGSRAVGIDFAYAIMKSLGYNPFWTIFGEGPIKVPKEIFKDTTPENHIRFEELEKDRIFMRQIDKSGLRKIFERILELRRPDQKLFKVFFERLFPEKYD